MKKLHAIVLSALIALTFGSQALAAALTPEDLFSDDRITDFAISPTGEYVAYVSPQGDTEIFTIAKVDGMEATFTTKMGSKRYVGRFTWVNDDRLLLWPAQRYGFHEIKYMTGEIQAMNYNGKKNTKLWGYRAKVRAGKQDPRWGFLSVTSRLEDEPDSIMITTQDGYGNYGTRRLRKMNIYNGRITPGERSSVRGATFIVDKKGTPILQWGVDKKGDNIVTFKDKNGEWQDLPDAKQITGAWSSDEQHVILSRNAGNNVYELVKFNANSQKTTVLASSANAEMNAILDINDKMIGYQTVKDGKPVNVYLDEQSEEAQFRRLIEKTFKTAKTDVHSSNKDGS
ncbi:MAG: hypothetical protein MJK04_11155, partial [Psychrosphaera sp.]|nr:hypothetical protein [Psychrosphaera sp.]